MFSFEDLHQISVADVTQGPIRYLSIQDVRIYPPKLRFSGAFIGRRFKDTITIQNCGNDTVHVRILQPSLFALKTKPQRQETFLAPGLKIVKTIQFQSCFDDSITCGILPIIVNGIPVDYNIEIKRASSGLRAEPGEIDFGFVNVGRVGKMQTISLTNTGTKRAHFAFDIKCQTLQMIADPMKGAVEVQSTVKICLTMLCNEEGDYAEEIWIKSVIPIPILIRCKVIQPKLLAFNVKSTSTFVLLDFPTIYIGSVCEKEVVIKNQSTDDALLCIVAEIEQKECSLEEARIRDDTFENFEVSPVEDLLLAHDGRPLKFKYKPAYQKANYHFCILRVIALDCKPLSKRFKYEKLKEHVMLNNSEASTGSVLAVENRDYDIPEFILKHEIPNVVKHTPELRTIRMCLYGSSEKASVRIVPDFLQINRIQFKERQFRELEVKNLSEKLPITVNYVNVPYVNVEPSKKFLKPLETVTIKASITPAKLGRQKYKIAFELLYNIQGECFKVGSVEIPIEYNCKNVATKPEPKFNMGITPMLVNEVGNFTEDVRFNTTVKLPRMAIVGNGLRARRSDSDFIAFPNDMPRSLEPWMKSKKCRTIFVGLPRNTAPIQQNKSYYKNYLKRQYLVANEKFPKAISDYNLTDKKLLLAEDFRIEPFVKIKENPGEPPESILTSLQLYNIKVFPRDIRIGVTSRSSFCGQTVHVKNGNSFPIRATIIPRKTDISFPKGSKKTIKPNKEHAFEINFYASNTDGIFSIDIDVVVNENYVYNVHITGEVVKHMVFVNTNKIVFDFHTNSQKYLDIYNPFSTTVYYQLNMTYSCFECEPSCGEIDGRKHVIAIIKYIPRLAPLQAELTIQVENRINQIIYVSSTACDLNVKALESMVKMTNIPLNIAVTEYIRIQNFENQVLYYTVTNPEPIPGLKVIPQKGKLYQRSVTILRVLVQITAPLSFACKLEIDVHKQKKIMINLVGNVIYPKIVVTPEVITFRKLVAHATDRCLFVVENKGLAVATIQFPVDPCKDYTITNTLELNDVTTVVTLLPNQKKQFCVHFNPIDLSTDWSYLPMLVNGILGLPSKVLSDTELQVDNVEQYMYHKDVILYRASYSVPAVKVKVCITEERVNFSNKNFKFEYFPTTLGGHRVRDSLRIWSAKYKLEEVCIRTDELSPSFSMKYIAGEIPEFRENSISVALANGAAMELEIRFHPSRPGLYVAKLPVYVKNFMGGAIYNFIFLEGTYPKATITPNEPVVYLEPIPLQTSTEREITLTTEYHLGYCELFAQADDPSLSVTFVGGNIISTKKKGTECIAKLSFTSAVAKILDSLVTITCKCGSRCEFTVKGCSENCTFTNHAFLRIYGIEVLNLKYFAAKPLPTFIDKNSYDIETMSLTQVSNTLGIAVNRNATIYPMFPDEYETSEYSVHMSTTLEVLELWIFNQGFYGKEFFKIPEGFAVPLTEKGFDTGGLPLLPYIQLLRNITGNSVVSHFYPDKKTNFNTKLEKIYCIWCVYKKAKKVLTSSGAFLPNVEPEYLLTYEQYDDYMEGLKASGHSLQQLHLPRDKFYKISKQNWLDFLLQTYKVFVLSRISTATSLKQHSCSEILKKSKDLLSKISKLLTAVEEKYRNVIYTPVENVLLCWLEHYYNKYRNTYWKGANYPEKTLKLFDWDLSTGVVLIVVTVAHCPYVQDRFKDCYFRPLTYEEYLYNAATLVQVWQNLGSSFEIQPLCIVNPNLLHMIMLTAYLYDFLPTLYPAEKIQMKAGINECTKQWITVSNSNRFKVKYTVKFFLNDFGCFSCKDEEVILNANSEVQLEVRYKAKRLMNEEAYVMLSGENSGYHYATSMVFILSGTLDLSRGFFIRYVSATMFKILKKDLTFQTPFSEAATFTIYRTNKPPVDLKTLDLRHYKSMVACQAPLLVHFDQDDVTTDEKGVAKLTFRHTAFKPSNVELYLVFRNEKVGDWAAILKIRCDKLDRTSVPIEATIDPKILTLNCLCRQSLNPNCPKIVTVDIPRRYELLWSTVEANYLSFITDERDSTFWKKYIREMAGLAILHRITKDFNLLLAKEFTELFACEKVPYTVQFVQKTDLVDIPSPFAFCSIPMTAKPVQMPVHVNGSEIPDEIKIEMISQNKYENRFYTIKFTVNEL